MIIKIALYNPWVPVSESQTDGIESSWHYPLSNYWFGGRVFGICECRN